MLASSLRLDNIYDYRHNVKSQRNAEKKVLCDPYYHSLLLFHFDCVVEIPGETVSVNAYATHSEGITPVLSTLDTSAVVLENKAQEILHCMYISHIQMLLIS
jgi:hypothetical protein